MSFISGALDKSVFNKGSCAAAIGKPGANGYAVVRISPNGPRLTKNNSQDVDVPIVGVLNDDSGFTYSIESNWTDLGGIAQSVLPESITKFKGAYEKVNQVANVAGAANMGAAYASKKIYQQSGFLTIKVPMMIVDWQGNGSPVSCSQLLSYYMLPRFITNMGDELEKVVDSALQELKNKIENEKNDIIKEGLQLALNAAEGLMKAPDAIDGFIESHLPADSITLSLYNQAKKNANTDKNDLYTLRSSPVPVKVEIGNFFKNDDMVITNCSFNFSKEMTRNGPLFVKIDLDLSTRMILTSMDSVGLVSTNTPSRYLTSTNFTGL